MAGIGFAGGLGQIGNAFFKGMDDARDRQFIEGQRARAVEEQKRADAERQGLSGIKTTEDVEVANPDYVEPVLKDDEGNDMPGVAAQPKTVSRTRNRSQAEIARDTANVYKSSGNIEKYTASTERAQKLTMDDANRQATALMATADSMPLMDYAKAAANIFSSDSLPYSIKGVNPDPAGSNGVMLTVQNDSNGVQKSVTFKDHATLTRALQSMYQPDTYNKILTTRAEAAAKAQENAQDPSKRYMRVGNSVYDTATNTFKEGPVPPGFVYDGEGADGQPRYVRGSGAGAGAGAGGKGGKAPAAEIDSATKLLTEFLGKSDGSPEGAARQARAVSLLDPLYQSNPGMSPRTAAAIAADAAADPTKVSMQLDKNTGLIGKVYRNPDFEGGRQYNLAPGSGTPEEMEKIVGKSGMTGVATDLVDSMIGALPQNQQGAARQQLISVAADPAQRKAYLAAAQEAGKDTTALSRQLDLIGRYVAPPPAAPGPKKVPAVGGIGGGGQGNYQEWLKAKEERDNLMSTVSKMSPDRRESYLASRLPDIEKRIEANKNYRTY